MIDLPSIDNQISFDGCPTTFETELVHVKDSDSNTLDSYSWFEFSHDVTSQKSTVTLDTSDEEDTGTYHVQLSFKYEGAIYTKKTYIELDITIPCPIVDNVLTAEMPEVQHYQVTDESLLFQLDTHVEKTGKCFLTYTMTFTPETTSETLILFDASERQFTFYEVEDLTVASIQSPYHVNYTVIVSADQAEVATVTQSFILNVTNPCAN